MSEPTPRKPRKMPFSSRRGDADNSHHRFCPPISTSNGKLLKLSRRLIRSEEHTSELQSLMRISYAVFCLKKNTPHTKPPTIPQQTRPTTTHIHYSNQNQQ